MRIPTEITIDDVTYDTRWIVTAQGSFVERLEILVSKVIYITLEKCTEDVSNKYKDEIRHLLAKNLALFLNNYADVLFNKDPEFIPDKIFINEQVFDTRYTNHLGSCNGKMGPYGILIAVNSEPMPIEAISMSDISQLISDMRAVGAPRDELSRAINHSVAVITAEKAILDRDASFSSNDIMELFKKYHR